MSDDLIEQLRARNPAPAPLPPPPIEMVLARIADTERRPSGSRWPGLLGLSLAVAVAVAIAVGALVSIGGGQHSTTPGSHRPNHRAAPAHSATGRATVKPVAGEAMRGSLQGPVLAFGPGSTGVIAFTQSTSASTAHPKAWLATTRNAGRSWSVARRDFSLFSAPVFDGSRDVWAMVVDAHQTLRFYVSHDDGQRWSAAQSAAAPDSVPGDVSVAGGMVWAVGTGSCSGPSCQWIVMRGSAAGDRLPPTAAQPLPPTNQNATTISAVSATTAYVTAPGRDSTAIYATHDGGRHWRQIPYQCAGGDTPSGATATHSGSLWRICAGSKRFFVVRSTDGGAQWSGKRLPFIPQEAFEPISSRVAWSQDAHGTIYRTADGGSSWQAVWHPGAPHGQAMPGASPILSAQSADDASLLVQLTIGPTSRGRIPRATNLVVYRTTDGGANWYPSIVKLPSG
ncbi:MAG: hypothetical protein ACRDMJ_18690 [Solirubrobacteraceae bacterium]